MVPCLRCGADWSDRARTDRTDAGWCVRACVCASPGGMTEWCVPLLCWWGSHALGQAPNVAARGRVGNSAAWPRETRNDQAAANSEAVGARRGADGQEKHPPPCGHNALSALAAGPDVITFSTGPEAVYARARRAAASKCPGLR